MREFVGTEDAARALDVSARRVRQLAAQGRYSARRVGGRWLMSADALRDQRPAPAAVGRSISARGSWAILSALCAQRPAWASRSEISRARRRVEGLHRLHAEGGATDDELVDSFRRLVRARAQPRGYHSHPAMTAHLLADADVVVGGVSAAAYVGADIVAVFSVELYTTADAEERLVRDHGLEVADDQPNVLIRTADETTLNALSREADTSQGIRRVAAVAVVAADLADANDARTRRAAVQLLRTVLDDYGTTT